jgi:hypothetical protein
MECSSRFLVLQPAVLGWMHADELSCWRSWSGGTGALSGSFLGPIWVPLGPDLGSKGRVRL